MRYTFAMSTEPDGGASRLVELEKFRGYLNILARLRFDQSLRRKMDPSDIVQQTLLEAHVSQKRFKGSSVPEQAAWLRRILVDNLANAGRDLRRAKRDVERERSLDAALEESSMRLEAWLAADQPSPSGRLAREERVLRLADALASLPDAEQETLVLRYCEDWTLDAIGERLGVSRNTAARLLREGLRMLKQKLEGPD
jgi:RNA polymerase sigma-70 factor (ECF subfamily)